MIEEIAQEEWDALIGIEATPAQQEAFLEYAEMYDKEFSAREFLAFMDDHMSAKS